MNCKIQLFLAGAGAAAGVYGLSRVFGGKRINTLPYGYGIKFRPPDPARVF